MTAPGGGQQRAGVQQLLLGDATAREYPKRAVREGTYLQKAGVRLFRLVLGLTVALCAALFAYLLLSTPSVPKVSSAGTMPDTAYVRVVLEQRAQVFSNFMEGISRLVLNLCLPLLTGILGYIFGQPTTPSSSDS